MRTKERKSFLWLMVLLCSAALLGVCFTPGLSNADKASNSVQDLFEMSPEDQPEDVEEDIYRDDVGLDPDAELEEAFGGRIQVTFISNSTFSLGK